MQSKNIKFFRLMENFPAFESSQKHDFVPLIGNARLP